MSSLPRPRGNRCSASVRQWRRLRRATVATGLLLSGILATAPGRAQALDAAEEGYDRTPAFGRSVVSTDDSTALVINPATLAFLPGEELRWSSTYLSNDAEVPWKGHALAFVGRSFPHCWQSPLAMRFSSIFSCEKSFFWNT